MTQEQLAEKIGTKKALYQELKMDIMTFNFRYFTSY